MAILDTFTFWPFNNLNICTTTLVIISYTYTISKQIWCSLYFLITNNWESSFSQHTAFVSKPVFQPIITMQILLSKSLILILQPITQLLILAIAKLISKIPPPSLPEMYVRILLPHKIKYFSWENLFTDIKNYPINDRFAVTIYILKLPKIYLVCN